MSRLDLERAEDIALNPAAATPRQTGDAFYWLQAKISELLDNEAPAFELRRYEVAHHRLQVWRSHARASRPTLQAAE